MALHTALFPACAAAIALVAVAGARADGAVEAIGAGCGPDGPTQSDVKPHASVAVPALVVGNRVRLTVLRADQTAGATVRLTGTDGKAIASTPSGGYSCVTPSDEPRRMSVPLTSFGHLLFRRQGAARAQGQLTLVNGSGARSELAFASVMVDSRLLAIPRVAARCRDAVASPKVVRRGGALGILVDACQPRPVRVSLVSLDGARRGRVALRHTFAVIDDGPTPTFLAIGAASPGRFRLTLSRDGRTIARQIGPVRILPADRGRPQAGSSR